LNRQAALTDWRHPEVGSHLRRLAGRLRERQQASQECRPGDSPKQPLTDPD
jgi:hypothetical protein